MSTFSELAAEMATANDVRRHEVVAGIIDRIQRLSVVDRQALLRQALDEHRVIGFPGEEWNPRRTLVGVVLHAIGVRVIESAEQRKLREEITDELAQLDGDLDAYRALKWIRSEEALQKHGIADDASSGE